MNGRMDWTNEENTLAKIVLDGVGIPKGSTLSKSSQTRDEHGRTPYEAALADYEAAIKQGINPRLIRKPSPPRAARRAFVSTVLYSDDGTAFRFSGNFTEIGGPTAGEREVSRHEAE